MFPQVVYYSFSFTVQKGSLLHLMAEKGQTDISNTLLTHGANMDAKDKVRNL